MLTTYQTSLGNRKKIAESKQFRYANKEQTDTDTKIKPILVGTSHFQATPFVSCITRGKYSVSQNKGQCLSESFLVVLFSQRILLFLLNPSADNCFQRQSTCGDHHRVSRDFVKSLRLALKASLHYTYLCHLWLGVRYFPITAPVWSPYWEAWSRVFVSDTCIFLRLWQTRGAEIAVHARQE